MHGPVFYIKKSIVSHSIRKKNKTSPFDIAAADSMSALPDGVSAMYNNSWYFMAHKDDGAVLIYRLAYRGDGRTEIWFYYESAAGEAYKSRYNYIGDSVRADVKTKLAGKNLTFCYEDDDMRFDGEFTATEAVFEFSRDVLPSVLASAVAEERWGREFRESSDLSSQVHYEQTGVLTGVLSLKKSLDKTISICAPAVRDHSYGDRDWGHMERHFWLCAVNDSQTLCYNAVCYPNLRNLKTGYFIDGAGRTVNIIDGPGFEIFAPESANAPYARSIALTAEDGKRIAVSLKKKHEIIYEMGEGVYCLSEGIGEYEIGGRAAKGIIEFGSRTRSDT